MSASSLVRLLHKNVVLNGSTLNGTPHTLNGFKRTATTSQSGSILPEPKKNPFGLIGLVCAVVPGLLIGAAISKNIANFLEENDLFVPSDDDDDDD